MKEAFDKGQAQVILYHSFSDAGPLKMHFSSPCSLELLLSVNPYLFLLS